MNSKSRLTRVAIYVGVAAVLAAIGYVGSHSLGRAALLAALGLVLGLVAEFSGALQSKGALPELRHDGYGVQTPSWYELEDEEKRESEESAEADAGEATASEADADTSANEAGTAEPNACEEPEAN